MKFKLEDQSLVKDYIQTIKTVEKVHWQGKMNRPPKHLENYNPGCVPEFLLLCLFWIFVFNISHGDTFIMLCSFSIPGYAYFYHIYQRSKERKLDLAKENTQYIITNERVIFILYQKETIHIHSIPYRNIQKVYSSKANDTTANIYLIPNFPVDFQTYKYWSQKPHDKLVMVQVKEYKKVLDLIQEHLV